MEDRSMRLRAPAYPLINVDPYFNVWSQSDSLTDTDTVHWTGFPNTISGVATIDGEKFRFCGAYGADIPAMKQISVDCDSFSTYYVFEEAGVKLKARFTTPVIPSDLYLLSRPVSYLELSSYSTDGNEHSVSVRVAVSEEICMNLRGDDDVITSEFGIGALSSVSIEKKEQKILSRSGDNLRIEWGRFYLTGEGETCVFTGDDGLRFVAIDVSPNDSSLITFAYDDIESIEYFGEHLRSYWNRNGSPITEEIAKAHADYRDTLAKCEKIDSELWADAVRAGGEKYAEMLQLAFRQSVGAHKLVLDGDGKVLFISKECYSNGCAATVDVSYPSIPLFLLYNPELVKGMMRPIYRFAASDDWSFDFAPHDCGQYPLLNGQVYGKGDVNKQMPVEECGNMLLMETCVALAENDPSFALEHIETLDRWVTYLIENGSDPANQLCTDDFAGHLAHNCNLSLKAIMGIAGYGILKGMCGFPAEEKTYLSMAGKMAASWAERASNGDGSYRLAFDKPGSFSMKYNIVWDKLFGTGLMPRQIIDSEVSSYEEKSHPYGLPLDNRQPYTKSDWLVWTATLASTRKQFEAMTDRLWDAYNFTPSRVPMTDWYWTVTSLHKSYKSRDGVEKSFRNRTVIGGLFIKLLEYRGILNRR